MLEFKPAKKTPMSEKAIISIRLDSDKLMKIDETANNAEISRNEFIIQCIDFALSNMSDDIKKKL